MATVWSPNKLYVTSSSRDGSIHVWNATSGHRLQAFPGNEVSSYDTAWSPCSTFIAAQDGSDKWNPMLKIWNIGDGTCLHSSKVNYDNRHSNNEIMSIAWSPCGKKIIACDDRGIFISLACLKHQERYDFS